MDFELDEAHRELRDVARAWVDKEVIPFAREWDRAESVDPAIAGKLGEMGFLGEREAARPAERARRRVHRLQELALVLGDAVEDEPDLERHAARALGCAPRRRGTIGGTAAAPRAQPVDASQRAAFAIGRARGADRRVRRVSEQQ